LQRCVVRINSSGFQENAFPYHGHPEISLVEQDQPLQRSEPLAVSRRPFGLLLAAHGERRTDADNGVMVRLARTLADKGVAAEIGFGFIKGSPTVDEAIGALSSRDIVVYPLFLSDGYFTRVALLQLVEGARRQDAGRAIRILPPLGLDPSLADVIADEAVAAAHSRANLPAETSVVLLAHGSKKDQASRVAAEGLADRLRQRQFFCDTRIALLEESPSLAEATEGVSGPIIVIGLFAGEGMHGSDDAKRLVAELNRDDTMLIGPVGALVSIETVIVSAVTRYIFAGIQPASI
jgi:sirohydrochlorin cobaltochelatase